MGRAVVRGPEISGARTATPAALVTPPDEREPLRVPWTAGEVPVGGNESTVSLTVLRPGPGA
ncbi:Lipoprotein OS=Streptomyces glaucescens OX=1907 GN=SGLAU_29975 PE=4 SV=1 [Streptomyces glaucescens]